MKIAIMTDVNAGLDYVGYDTGITVLRSTVNFKNEVLVDGIDIKADEFYRRISQITNASDIPSTSAPSLGDIYDAIDNFIEQGYTDVIHFPISFQLSATGPTVQQVAKEYHGRIRIHVIDTKLATYLQGYLAVNAKQMAENGATVEEIIERSGFLINHSKAYFVVDDLSYLVKNGRLSNAAGFLAGLLRIKPVLEITSDGRIVTKEKIKVYKYAVDRALELMFEFLKDKTNVKVFLFHSLREDIVKKMLERINEVRPDIQGIEIHYITPAVGAHIGAGVVGIGAFLLE